MFVPERLKDSDYLLVIRNAPLVSIDFLVMHDGKALLGLRRNKPAQGKWFVPGGRILKGETVAAALARVSKAEFGQLVMEATLAGVDDHFYLDNALGVDDVTTHYVVLVFVVNAPEIHPEPDSQHSEFRWWGIEDLIASHDVHDNAKRHFLRSLHNVHSR